METITSKDNPRIKQIVKLRKAARRKKDDLIIIEGAKELDMAARAGIEPEAVFYCSEYSADRNSADRFNEERVFPVAPAVFDRISLRQHPDGVLALARPRYLLLNDLKLSANPLLVILDGVEKPGNLGAILRTADAVGADAVVVCDPQTDIYNPNVIRASRGTVFTEQVVVAGSEKAIAWLEAKKIKTFATMPDAPAEYTDTDFTVPGAVVIGTEHEGLSDKWLRAADEKIKIPMKGKIDSLNASVSAAIILYEALRQRSV